MTASRRPPAPVRWLWIAFGGIAVGLAVIGAVLPLVPTTPFLLVAAFAFARSSPRLHGWLVNHRRFGPLIRNWQDHGAISRRTKLISLSLMAVMPPAALWMGAPLWTVAVQTGVLACSGLFIATRPHGPKEKR